MLSVVSSFRIWKIPRAHHTQHHLEFQLCGYFYSKLDQIRYNKYCTIAKKNHLADTFKAIHNSSKDDSEEKLSCTSKHFTMFFFLTAILEQQFFIVWSEKFESRIPFGIDN